MQGLVDQDVQPFEALSDPVSGDIELTTGVEADESAVQAALDGMDVLFTTSRLPISRRVLEDSQLQVVAKLGTGLDNIDLDAASEFGILVTHTPGVNALSVAEHTLGLLLANLRQTSYCQRLLESGHWRDETPVGTQLSGTTVGIVGYGDIGRRFARLLDGFNVTVLATDPYVQPEEAELTGAELTSLDDLLERSDVVTVNAELTEETRGLLGEAEFAAMQSSAVVVNTARGAIVDEIALVDALRDGAIAGAGLDVFESEPLAADSPLHDFDNVTLTPHIAARTKQASVECIDRLATNALALLNGEPVPDRYLAVPPRD
ncbi:NAD(P)-dependent oxidoreductase [Halorussus halophilus]|uniref:NAD(P)-dependent oxidoreductase n=1 Tax=Halorussus halophilus TaxID=2650975 RepID=UPI0013016073|nr:hydroxyacid dehydrogenase [Halorussus halophilus]